MPKVKLTHEWKGHKPGEVVDVNIEDFTFITHFKQGEKVDTEPAKEKKEVKPTEKKEI